MKYTITVTFNSETEKNVFVKIINRVKEDGAITPLDFGNLTGAIKDMDNIEDNLNGRIS